MAERLHGVLLAVSGEDADLLRAIDAHGSGLRVVRRCADTAELLSAAMAGLAALVVVDTEFDDLDLSVVDRLARAGATGIVLTSADQAERWAVAGWPVEERSIDPGAVRARLQVLAHAVENGPPAPTMRVAAPSQSDDGADDQLWAELAAIEPSAPAVPEDAGGADGSIPVEKAPSPAEPERRPSDASDGGPPHGAGAQTSGTNGANGGIVVVWGPRGSYGRTTIAAALAHSLAPAGGTILVDSDLEGPCLSQVLGLPENSSGLATAARLAGHGRLDEETLSELLVPVGESERLLSGLGRPGRWRELPPSAMSEVWSRCRGLAAWTVVDVSGGPIDDSVDEYTLEPGRGAVAAELVRRADVVLVVGGADPVGVRRLLQLLGDLDDEMRPAGRLEVVVTRVRSSVAGPSPQRAVRDALERYGRLSDVTLVPDDPVSAAGSGCGGARAGALGRSGRAGRRGRAARNESGRGRRLRPPVGRRRFPHRIGARRWGRGPRIHGARCLRLLHHRRMPGPRPRAESGSRPPRVRGDAGDGAPGSGGALYGARDETHAVHSGALGHTWVMRVYLPATAADLSAPTISPRTAHAVTSALARALPDEDEETLEASASLCAADASLMLLSRPGAGVLADRRVVIAADVDAAAVSEVPVSEEILPGTVQVGAPVAWEAVAALLVDEREVEADVRAARAGDEAAFERVGEADLLWFDVSEREYLAAELG